MSKPLPKALREFLAKHPEKFDEGHSELDGFNPSGGYAHWVYLKTGWNNGDYGSHIIHECTVKEIIDAFKNVGRCDCDDCRSRSVN